MNGSNTKLDDAAHAAEQHLLPNNITDEERAAVRAKLRAALKPFNLTEAQENEVVTKLETRPLFYAVEREQTSDNRLYNFYEKVSRFIALLKEREINITLDDYVTQACLKQPALFCRNPKTVLLNLTGTGIVEGKKRTGIVDQLAEKGVKIDLGTYVTKACLKLPSLFYQDPDTIILNLTGTGIVEEKKRTGIVDQLAERGVQLDLHTYVTQACLKLPSLFCSDPDTILLNFTGTGMVGKKKRTGIVDQLAERGVQLDLHTYVTQACLKLPSLFCRDPDAVLGHIHLIQGVVQDLAKRGIHVQLNGHDQEPHETLTPLQHACDFVMKNPILLALADENLMMRYFYAAKKYARQEATPGYIFKNNRSQAQKELLKALQTDPSKRLPGRTLEEFAELTPEDKKARANNMLARALVFADMLPPSLLGADEQKTWKKAHTGKLPEAEALGVRITPAISTPAIG